MDLEMEDYVDTHSTDSNLDNDTDATHALHSSHPNMNMDIDMLVNHGGIDVDINAGLMVINVDTQTVMALAMDADTNMAMGNADISMDTDIDIDNDVDNDVDKEIDFDTYIDINHNRDRGMSMNMDTNMARNLNASMDIKLDNNTGMAIINVDTDTDLAMALEANRNMNMDRNRSNTLNREVEYDSVNQSEGEREGEMQGEGEDRDKATPIFGFELPSLPSISLPLPDMSEVAENLAANFTQAKEDLVEKIEIGDKLVDDILTETRYGAILDELFFAGNMPVFQAYLQKYSFLGDYVAKESNWKESVHFVVISLACCISIVLRGVSQVYLCNNPLTGVMICIGLYLTDPKLLVFGLVGTTCATLFASVVCLPASTEIVSGLTGYDGALIGCAVATFIKTEHTETPGYGAFTGSFRSKGMGITMVLSAMAGLLHMSARHSSELPALTLGFNICMLAFLYILTDDRSDWTELGWAASDDDYPEDVDQSWIQSNFHFFHDATARGVGQFMFVSNTTGAWMVILGIALTSRIAALAAVTGSLSASIAARYIFVVPPASLVAVHNGLYGYCAAGVCVSLGGGVFYHASPISLAIGIIGAIFCVFIQLAVEAILKTDGLPLPVLTIPFVATTWLMMLSRSAWLDPRNEAGGDMDDLLFQDKDRKRERFKRVSRPVPTTDDPKEAWNTRDKSQSERRSNFNAALSKPFSPMMRKLPSATNFLHLNAAEIPKMKMSASSPELGEYAVPLASRTFLTPTETGCAEEEKKSNHVHHRRFSFTSSLKSLSPNKHQQVVHENY
jgi:urea transporter